MDDLVLVGPASPKENQELRTRLERRGRMRWLGRFVSGMLEETREDARAAEQLSRAFDAFKSCDAQNSDLLARNAVLEGEVRTLRSIVEAGRVREEYLVGIERKLELFAADRATLIAELFRARVSLKRARAALKRKGSR